MAEVKEQPVPVSEPVYEQPAAQPTPSYKVVTGSEEWKNDLFSCMDGGLEANDNLCTFIPFLLITDVWSTPGFWRRQG